MKKLISLAIVGFVAIMLSVGTSFAAVDCDGMAIQSTGTTPYTASGLFVKVVPPTGGNACGTATVSYFLDTNNTDATYATILTALSLTKNIFIQVSDAAANSLLLVVSVKQ